MSSNEDDVNELITNWPVYQEKYSLPDYYLNAFKYFLSETHIKDARILEIGGSSIPHALAIDFLNARRWVSVDMIEHASGSYQYQRHKQHYDNIGLSKFKDFGSLPKQDYLIFDESATDIPAYFDAQFDIIISINSFEHILDLEKVLAKCHASLRPGGVLLSIFGPIWSCIVGSHFWINDEFNFNNPNPLPGWAHLLMSDQEIRDFLLDQKASEDTIHQVDWQLFHSDFVNRLFYEDYESLLKRSGFQSFDMGPMWPTNVPKMTLALLRQRYPEYKEFAAYGIRVKASKADTKPTGKHWAIFRNLFSMKHR